jgi:hypothetical protein
LSVYSDLYRQIESALDEKETSGFEFANKISEPFFFELLSSLGESHLFGEKKYQGADGVFLPSRRPMLIDVKFDSGISRKRPENNGKNLFAEITKDGDPSSWLSAHILGSGIGMINWYRQEAFLFDPLSVRRIIELWYQRKLTKVVSNIGTTGILIPCSEDGDIGRTEPQIIFALEPHTFKRIK